MGKRPLHYTVGGKERERKRSKDTSNSTSVEQTDQAGNTTETEKKEQAVLQRLMEESNLKKRTPKQFDGVDVLPEWGFTALWDEEEETYFEIVKIFYSNGSIYKIFKRGMNGKTGFSKKYWPRKVVDDYKSPQAKSELEIIDARPSEESSFDPYFNQSLMKVCSYNDGIKQGKYESYYNNGFSEEEGYYQEGKMNGYWKNYSRTGGLFQVTYYEGGLRNGSYKYYLKDDVIGWKGTYREGRKFGDWMCYHPNGNVRKIKFYNEKGRLNGEYQTYDESGHPILKKTYCSGNLHGDYKEYENGKLTFQTCYVNGNVEGFSFSYDKNGLRRVAYSENDVLIAVTYI